MGRRPVLPVAELELIGGLPCLDLVNTTGARDSGAPRERLRRYEDVLVWCCRAGVLSTAEANRLRAAAAGRPAEARRALARVLRLREDLYRLLRPVAEGSKPSPEAVRQVGKWWRADRRKRELTAVDRGFALRLRASGDELDAMIWPLVSSAVELLVSDLLATVKRCGECDWLFVDTSKNGARRWCKKQCGDRVRARRHYRAREHS